jgi:hypothetical protein
MGDLGNMGKTFLVVIRYKEAYNLNNKPKLWALSTFPFLYYGL